MLELNIDMEEQDVANYRKQAILAEEINNIELKVRTETLRVSGTLTRKGDKCMDNKARELVNVQGQVGTKAISQNKINVAVDLLNELIATNRGIIAVYHTAVERLDHEANVEIVQAYTEQHETFVTELSNMVVRYGGEPATAAGGGSLVKQAWVTLKAAVTEGDGPVLAEVTQDAEKVLEAYGEAMGQDLPDDARELIRKHMSQAHLTHEKLSALSAVYNK